MSEHYPVKFTLEDGINVEVNKKSENTFDYILTPKNGDQSRFTFVEEVPRDKNIDSLNFDQLNAVRRFWLEQEKME
ncbi:MAG: hypothetical protein M3139_10210 [Bacteroidota bacterium]|nr:hypothetical protein [Bacteroidota bacterium]